MKRIIEFKGNDYQIPKDISIEHGWFDITNTDSLLIIFENSTKGLLLEITFTMDGGFIYTLSDTRSSVGKLLVTNAAEGVTDYLNKMLLHAYKVTFYHNETKIGTLELLSCLHADMVEIAKSIMPSISANDYTWTRI